MYRKTYLEIDLDKVFENADLFERHTNKKLMAVVKSNAYGGIDYYIASILEERGCDFFAVSSMEEAVRLRKHGIKSNILIMGYANSFDEIRKNNLSVIIPSIEYIRQYGMQLSNVKVHVKVNTGLNRLGVYPDELNETMDILKANNAKIEGIMTHMACGSDIEYTNKQYKLFENLVANLNYDFKYIHTCATDPAIYLDDKISNYVRIGLGLYGYANIDEPDIGMKPALTLMGEIVQCKKVPKGQGVSYGHDYISDGEGYILTVAAGYADGVSRDIKNHQVFVEGEDGTVVGTVCMDLLMVKTNNYHEAGGVVEIIGEHHNLKDRAREYKTNRCKIITDITDRVTRIYLQNGKIVKELNPRNDQ